MSGIQLIPEGEREAIDVPDASIVIGRGPFLEVTDKRVSRNHALLEVIDGKLHLIPTHTNPCFFRQGGKVKQQVLQQNVRQPLEEGDMFSLLPDQLFYTVSYGDAAINGRKGKTSASTKSPVKKEPVQHSPVRKGKTNKPVRKDADDEEDDVKSEDKTGILSVIQADGKKMAMPLSRKRRLPAWMMQLSLSDAPAKKKLQGRGAQTTAKRPAPSPRKAPPKKKTLDDDFIDEADEYEKPEKLVTKSPRASAKRKQNLNEDFIEDDDYEEESLPKKSRKCMSDEESGERRRPQKTNQTCKRQVSGDDNEEESSKRKPSTKRQRKKTSDEDDDDYDQVAGNKRQKRGAHNGHQTGVSSDLRPKRAATKKRGSYVDEVMLGEDFGDSDDMAAQGDSDSEFQVDGNDDADSGSDWEQDRGSQKSKKASKRTPARKGRRGKSRKDSEDDFEESDDEYIPRPSKRRGAVAQQGRKAADSEEEDNQKKAKKGKTPCYYGIKCYRKNPDHFKQFSHPGDADNEEAVATSAKGRKVGGAKTSKPAATKAPLKKKTKKDDEEEDDDVPNTYDYNDSFINDASQSLSQAQPSDTGSDDDEEEELEDLKKEAKSFLKNKKMLKPL